MKRGLARIGAVLLLLVPAIASAQGAQKASVGDGGGGSADFVYQEATSDVPPPTKPKPLGTEDVADAAKGTYSFGGVATEAADKFAPTRQIRSEMAPAGKIVKAGGTIINTVDGVAKVADTYATTKLEKGEDAARQEATKVATREAAAMLIDRCVDTAINVACATTGPAAPGCIVGAQVVKTCVEVATGKSIGQRAAEGFQELMESDSPEGVGATAAPTEWKSKHQDYVDYISAQQPAQSQQVGCHPGHDEIAHPKGCFDYTR